MKIEAQEGIVPKQWRQPDRPPSDLPWHMAWRRALEQAQWAERADARSDQPSSAVAAQSNAGMSPAHPPVSVSEEKLPATLLGTQVTSGTETHTSPLSSPGSWVSTAQGPALDARPLPVAESPRVAQPLPDRPRVAPSEARPVATVPGDWMHWLPRNMQMSVQGQSVRASVRDADLDADRAQDLYVRLHAQLREWGLDLDELFVNGHRIVAAT